MTKAQLLANKTGWKNYGIEFKNDDNLDKISSPIILEIGFGMGESLFLDVKNHPDHFYIGVEVHKPGIGCLIAKCQKENISNIKIFDHDAREVLQTHIKDHSLDKIQIYFPDPWPKKRHHKRRLIQKDFLLLCHQKLKQNGIIHIATDWQDYSDEIKKVFSELNVCFQSSNELLHSYSRPETKFERRGKKLSHVISDLLFKKL